MKTGIFMMVLGVVVALAATFSVVTHARAEQSSITPFTLLSSPATSSEVILVKGGHHGGGHYAHHGGGRYRHHGCGYRHYRRGFYGYGGWYGGPGYVAPYYDDDACWQWDGYKFVWVCP